MQMFYFFEYMNVEKAANKTFLRKELRRHADVYFMQRKYQTGVAKVFTPKRIEAKWCSLEDLIVGGKNDSYVQRLAG